ncbi:hypothetical protein Tco_0370563 [Tanacetum coccineum]
MSTANQQTLVESGTEGRPLILEKGSYVPWANRFLRFFDIKREEGELIRNSIDNGMPNDIYNSGDACKDAQDMWKQIKRLMHGTNISKQERHSRLMNEFDKFVTEDGESLTSVNARFSTLINNMDQNKVKEREISINTKLLNSLQLEWSKYVTLTRQKSNKNQATNAGNGLVQKIEDNEENVQRIARTTSTMGKTNMLLAAKDEVGVNLDAEENDFMLMNAYVDDQLEEPNASVNASQIDLINGLFSKGVHEHKNHEKFETVIHTFVDDQIDSDIIFDDPYVEDNTSGQAEHDLNDHDQSYADI